MTGTWGLSPGGPAWLQPLLTTPRHQRAQPHGRPGQQLHSPKLGEFSAPRRVANHGLLPRAPAQSSCPHPLTRAPPGASTPRAWPTPMLSGPGPVISGLSVRVREAGLCPPRAPSYVRWGPSTEQASELTGTHWPHSAERPRPPAHQALQRCPPASGPHRGLLLTAFRAHCAASHPGLAHLFDSSAAAREDQRQRSARSKALVKGADENNTRGLQAAQHGKGAGPRPSHHQPAVLRLPGGPTPDLQPGCRQPGWQPRSPHGLLEASLGPAASPPPPAGALAAQLLAWPADTLRHTGTAPGRAPSIQGL